MQQATSAILVEAYEAAPAPIRVFLDSGKFDDFLHQLQDKTDLPDETFKKVSNEILMMLLGMTTPIEFPSNLKEQAELTDDLTRIIIEETNREIFVPLQKTASSAVENAGARTPIAPVVPVMKIEVPQGTPVVTASRPPLPVHDEIVPVLSNLPSGTEPVRPAPVAAPVMPQAPQPVAPVAPKPVQPAPAPISMPISEATPTAMPMRTMAHDLEAMKEGKVPDSFPAPRAMQSSAAAPRPAPQMPPKPMQPSANAQELANTLKKYGIDPYREAVE